MLPGVEAGIARRKLAKRRPNMEGARPYRDRPEGADCLPGIKHIVVLMMENHSYDNYFGMLTDRGDGFPLNHDGEPLPSNPASGQAVVQLRRFEGTVQAERVPSQTWHACHVQWNSGACDGFVRSVEETLPHGHDATVGMSYWTEEDIPFYYGLARVFPLATRWFSSCLGPTFPNRRFLVAGTAHGLIDDLPIGMLDYPEAGTIFDMLSANGISWANYHHVPRWKINFKRVAGAGGADAFRLLGVLSSSIFPAIRKHLMSKMQATAELYPLGTLRSLNHLRPIDRFFSDARAGKLPAVTFVDPDFSQWSEENPQDIRRGEAFSARVINAVMSGKGWPDTLLLWLYDEHGGYFDHVAPPAAPEPDSVPGVSPIARNRLLRLVLGRSHYAPLIAAADAGPSTYDRLGFRVPAVIVSPYAKPDYVTDTIYDHTSVLKLIETKWNLPALTKRDAAANSPLDALDLDGPPHFLEPPLLPSSALPSEV